PRECRSARCRFRSLLPRLVRPRRPFRWQDRRVEFLERSEHDVRAEVWRVRIDGAIATARVFTDEDYESNAQIARGTQRWLGFRHARVVPVLSVSDVTPRFVIATGDERGPSITRAAKQLADANIDREAWAVGEIIALADALTAMAAHAGET